MIVDGPLRWGQITDTGQHRSKSHCTLLLVRPKGGRVDVMVQLLGANVRHHRKLKGMTQERLALDAGMERSYVSDLERGMRNPSVRALGKLAEALGVDPKVLLDVPPKPLARL